MTKEVASLRDQLAEAMNLAIISSKPNPVEKENEAPPSEEILKEVSMVEENLQDENIVEEDKAEEKEGVAVDRQLHSFLSPPNCSIDSQISNLPAEEEEAAPGHKMDEENEGENEESKEALRSQVKEAKDSIKMLDEELLATRTKANALLDTLSAQYHLFDSLKAENVMLQKNIEQERLMSKHGVDEMNDALKELSETKQLLNEVTASHARLQQNTTEELSALTTKLQQTEKELEDRTRDFTAKEDDFASRSETFIRKINSLETAKSKSEAEFVALNEEHTLSNSKKEELVASVCSSFLELGILQ